MVLRRPVASRVADGGQAQLGVGDLVGGGAAFRQGGAVKVYDVRVAKIAAERDIEEWASDVEPAALGTTGCLGRPGKADKNRPGH